MKRKVKKVIDGDTFEVVTRIGDTNRVRLAGYNAPEEHQSGGKGATNRLRSLIGGKTVSIVPKAMSYGRVVADVRLHRRDVSKRMRHR